MTGSLWVPSAHSDQSAHYQGPWQFPSTQERQMVKFSQVFGTKLRRQVPFPHKSGSLIAITQ